MRTYISAPKGYFSVDDAAAQKRKEIAEKLKRGENVSITNSGEVVTPDDSKAGGVTLTAPPGKLATSFYWYERDAVLYKSECEAMKTFFPDFKQEKLDDGRLCWVGTLNPRGADGGVWNILAVYQHNHPNNHSYGGSVCVYSIKPDLEELFREIGNLPHLLKDQAGHLYMCTARMEDVDAGGQYTTSAAKSIGWAVKWIWMVEGWLQGELGDEVFDHTF
jgi:hypothetical protein